MSRNLYLVPYDFTPVADKALAYALSIGSHIDTEIRLIHLASDKAKGLAKIGQLDKVIANLTPPPSVEVTRSVRVGDIFVDIGKIAKQEKAQLVVMGTHGVKGLQHISGSFAMKVITSSDCPFLIVQKETPIKEIKEVAVPIDLTKESLQIVNIAGDMANIFGANIHVLAEKQSDEILNTRLQNRIGIVSTQYEDRGINAEIHLLSHSGGYSKKILLFAKEKNIDMIAIAYHSESLLPQFDSFAQSLITNSAGLPVLIINSKLASALYF